MSEREELKAVVVVWSDAFDGPGGWVDPAKYAPFIIDPITIGFVLDDDDDASNEYFTFYSSYYYDEDDELMCSNPMHIPRGMIKSITPVKINLKK